MSDIKIEQFLEAVSPDSPSGEDLQYDAKFLALEQAAQGKPEQVMGDKKIEAEPPDWRAVCQGAQELLLRTKDFRIAANLARGSLVTLGFGAFRDSLTMIQGYVNDYWDSVHPQLDPDDANDPTFRVNVLSSLCDSETTLRFVDRAELVRTPRTGPVSLRDIAIAKGDFPAAADAEATPDWDVIHGAFMEVDLEELKGTFEAVREAIAVVSAMEKDLTDRVGVDKACSFEPLVGQLKKAEHALAERLEERGEAQPEDDPDGSAGETADAGPGAPAAGPTGTIRSRQDVIRVLEQVCKYYEKNEPSSPVPMLLNRAKRIASKSFLEIIQDLSPKALNDMQAIGGIDGEGDGSK